AVRPEGQVHVGSSRCGAGVERDLAGAVDRGDGGVWRDTVAKHGHVLRQTTGGGKSGDLGAAAGGIARLGEGDVVDELPGVAAIIGCDSVNRPKGVDDLRV